MKRIVNALGKLNCGKRAYVVVLLCAATAIASPAQTFTTLHSFDGTDGSNPHGELVQSTDGNLYGTTDRGGSCGSCGTVFKFTLSGKLTTLHSFNFTDGDLPIAGLVQATDGNFYGTTYQGGATSINPQGGGTVFKITASGTLTTLYSFCSQSGCTDGLYPMAALVQASNGNFYGTTSEGGANSGGTVFKITLSGKLTTLHNFNFTDGAYPSAQLVQATDGNFYGTTQGGGANCASSGGCGTVFKITPTGTLTTFYSFCSQSGCTDGAEPYAGLIQATDGNFYGTTSGGHGTVFKITPSGTLTTLYNFCSQSGCADGDKPSAGLIQATDGNFYGTTYFGGANGPYDGTVFKITPSGMLTTLHSFNSGGGTNPAAALVQATNGSFYGTAACNGFSFFHCDDGTVFRLSVHLGPFVETQPTSGNVGATVKILGTNLTGATRVTFNGTAAAFKVLSSSLITTTVPASATTGKVRVVTPSGTLSSNVPFRVR
jgi:uncharacterized repeat protein (TIGR03803 family)